MHSHLCQPSFRPHSADGLPSRAEGTHRCRHVTLTSGGYMHRYLIFASPSSGRALLMGYPVRRKVPTGVGMLHSSGGECMHSHLIFASLTSGRTLLMGYPLRRMVPTDVCMLPSPADGACVTTLVPASHISGEGLLLAQGEPPCYDFPSFCHPVFPRWATLGFFGPHIFCQRENRMIEITPV